MATPREAGILIQDFEKLRSLLAESASAAAACRMEIAAAADNLKKQEVHRILNEIPTEELNREKRGFRIKTLKDSGYLTAADLEAASVRELADINGISDEGAAEIKNFVDDLSDQASSGVKIRLSTDDKSSASSRLISAILKYQRCLEPASECRKLITYYDQYMPAAIAAMKPMLKGLRWFFTSRSNKELAWEAYAYLENEKKSGFIPKTAAVLVKLAAVLDLPEEEAWKAFENNPIPFFTALEDVCPGMLGTEDDLYGLPEEMAKSIQEESYQLDGLRCQLRRYQEWGVKYILRQKRVLLGDEMGLGKTVQAIAAMVALRNSGGHHFLVVCPASVLENWCREIRKHSDLSVIPIHGQTRMEQIENWIQNGGVAVTTYETTGFFRFPTEFQMSMLVVDEAHYIKNPDAQRTRNVKQICRQTDRLLFMTGTALENKVDEMIELISILQPETADKVRRLASLSAAPKFREEAAPVYYRRRRQDVLTELPDLIETEEWCSLYPDEELLYESAVLSGRYADARRVSWNSGENIPSCKAERMMELIEEAREENRKIIVFSFFLDTIRTVRKLLGGSCLQPITGAVPPKRRQEIIDEFGKSPAGTVLTAQIQAGGTGLNIQAASVVILCEPQFKPSIENQAISRAYRMGQTRNVLVYRLLCENTVDERITALLEEKQKSFDAFADQSAAALENFDLDESSFQNIMKEEAERIQNKNTDSPQSEEEK